MPHFIYIINKLCVFFFAKYRMKPLIKLFKNRSNASSGKGDLQPNTHRDMQIYSRNTHKYE